MEPSGTKTQPARTPTLADAPTDAPRQHLSPVCCRGAVLQAEYDTGLVRIIPLTCKSWTCPHCAPRLAAKWATRIQAAEPTRFITLTTDPNRFANAQDAYFAASAALPKLVTAARKRGWTFEYAGLWELTAAGWPHLHICQRGSYIPQEWLKATWNNLGVGCIVDVRSIRHSMSAIRYVCKYLTKTKDLQTVVPWHHRVVRASRGFFPKPEQPDLPAPKSGSFTMLSQYAPHELADFLTTYSEFEREPDDGSGTIVLRHITGQIDNDALCEIIVHTRGGMPPWT